MKAIVDKLKMWNHLIGDKTKTNKVTREDKRILNRHTKIELADMSNLLNCWKWPKELPNPEPAEYVPDDRRSHLMSYIADKVGEKLVSRRWNKDRMTDSEHEIWWNSARSKAFRKSMLNN